MDNLNIGDLNEFHLDMLREIENIGMGNAATSLSDMLGQKIDVSVPNVDVIDISEVYDKINGAENMVVGIIFNMTGDLEGCMLFILEEQFALDMIKRLMQVEVSSLAELDEAGCSVLQEVANVMAGNFLRSLSDLTNFTIQISVPFICVDMLGAIMNIPISQFGMIGNKVLLMQENILGDHCYYDSFLLLAPTVDSLSKLINKVGNIYG